MSNRPNTDRKKDNLNNAPHGTMLALHSHITRLLGEEGLTLDEIATMVCDPESIAKGAAGFVRAFRKQEYYIDCHEPRPVKIGDILWHWCGETIRWDPKRIKLFISEAQRSGQRITGNELRALLGRDRVLLNACVLDWLLSHRHLIPKEWRTAGFIIFLGTAYAGHQVRCLHWDDIHESWEVVILSLDATCDSSWKVAVYEPIWRERDGVIDLTVTSDGTTAEEWIKERNDGIGGLSDKILLSPDFKPSFGETHKVRILKGELFADGKRTAKNIREEATRRRLRKPGPEIACLIWRELNRTDFVKLELEQVVAMHDPIKLPNRNDPCLLGIFRCKLDYESGSPNCGFERKTGFAFVE